MMIIQRSPKTLWEYLLQQFPEQLVIGMAKDNYSMPQFFQKEEEEAEFLVKGPIEEEALLRKAGFYYKALGYKVTRTGRLRWGLYMRKNHHTILTVTMTYIPQTEILRLSVRVL
jgi:hypothetical protein